jgi:hypothetical protein
MGDGTHCPSFNEPDSRRERHRYPIDTSGSQPYSVALSGRTTASLQYDGILVSVGLTQRVGSRGDAPSTWVCSAPAAMPSGQSAHAVVHVVPMPCHLSDESSTLRLAEGMAVSAQGGSEPADIFVRPL